MTLRIEQNPDGSMHYISDGPVVLTGPTTGEVELPDGTVVDVTAPVIEVESDEQGALIADAIAVKFNPQEV